MFIRRYRQKDCKEIVLLFYDTVHSVNASHYTESQLAAWAPEVEEIDLMGWDKSFNEQHTIIAEENNMIVGFGNINNTGYLDKLFVHKKFQKQGIAREILDQLEQYAKHKEVKFIITESSITAKGFFEKYGYQVIKEQQVERKRQFLTNFLMRKNLA